jgi:hypothetical protein
MQKRLQQVKKMDAYYSNYTSVPFSSYTIL